MSRPSPIACGVALFASVACGPAPSTPEPPKTHEVRAGAPSAISAPMSDRVSLGAPIEALGATNEGTVVVVAGGSVYEVALGAATKRALYASGTDPTSLGAVRGISSRRAAGAWIAAANGLFVLDGEYVSKSPIVPDPPGALTKSASVRAVTDAKDGTFGGLWLGSDSGLYRWRADAFEHLSVSGHEGAADAVAIDTSSEAALAAVGGKLALLVKDGERTVSEALPLDVGTSPVLAGGNAELFAAGPNGLLRWKKGAEPGWTHVTLSADGAAPAPVGAIAVDAVSQTVWIRTADALVKIDGEAVSSFGAPALPSSSRAHLAIDDAGDVWTNDGSDAVRFKTGVGTLSVSFEKDVKPWAQTNCARCHSDFTDVTAFSPRAEAGLLKVRAGDMPRCEGGVPCPVEQRMSANEYAVLEAWIRGGKQP